jgi:uncharacterized delta-60 repeat protein
MVTTIATIAALLTAVMIPPAFAAPGDLDPTFGIGGTVTTDFTGAPSMPGVGTATLIQQDGKIVLAGRVGINQPGIGGTSQFGLARYNTNGALDATFGTGGEALASFFPPPQVNLPRAIAIQADGKLVVAGMAGPNEQTASAALARFNTNGTLDTAFGTAGKVLLNVAAGLGNGFRGVTVQPDGKIIAVGAAGPDGLVARFNTDGSLDTTFGGAGTGWVAQPVLSRAHFFDVELDALGMISVAGFVINGVQNDFLAVRYTSSGTLDTTFGSSGIAVVSASILNDIAFALALDSSGKLVLTGVANATNPFGTVGGGEFGTVRLNTNGTLDTTFGTGGIVTTDLTVLMDEARSINIQSDGKIVVTGDSLESTPFPFDPITGRWTLIRYTANGALDTTFGAGGVVITNFGAVGDSANTAVIDANGKLVVGGAATVTKPNGLPGVSFAVARYEL